MKPGKACRVSEALELLYSTLLGPKPQNHRENRGFWPLGLENAGSGAAKASNKRSRSQRSRSQWCRSQRSWSQRSPSQWSQSQRSRNQWSRGTGATGARVCRGARGGRGARPESVDPEEAEPPKPTQRAKPADSSQHGPPSRPNARCRKLPKGLSAQRWSDPLYSDLLYFVHGMHGSTLVYI